jgi:hypothetical protein
MARKTRRSGEKNDGKDLTFPISKLEMEQFMKDLLDNTPNEDQFKENKDE